MREAYIPLAANGGFDPCEKLLGQEMVAKESRFIEELCNKTWLSKKEMKQFRVSSESFHKQFCKTQEMAQKLAVAFNSKIEQQLTAKCELLGTLPSLSFLQCFVYLVYDVGDGNAWSCREVLAEKRLDAKLEYKKWNNNAGFVDGQKKARTDKRVGFHLPPIPTFPEDCKTDKTKSIPEEEEEEEDMTPLHFASLEGVGGKRKRQEVLRPEHVPQAFSHFSYHSSGRSMLVCDLQGVYDPLKEAFELTDPVIHQATEGNRARFDEQIHGRTDKGNKGIADFFKTHRCNAVCRLLNLEASLPC